MTIDNKTLTNILSMSDDELKKLVAAAACSGGVHPPEISSGDIAKLRAALGELNMNPSLASDIIRKADICPNDKSRKE